MRKIQLVYSNPVPGMEDEFNEWYSAGTFTRSCGSRDT